MVIGYVGYLAFGASVKSVILFNLPNEDPVSITAKCFYVLTICGSFVLVIQPIFYVIESSVWYKRLGSEKRENEDSYKKAKEEPMMEEEIEGEKRERVKIRGSS
jgi:amino acid permease